ncbi:hypothetical protein ACFFUS_13980 [Vibrio gallaecicus]|uniref:hypothetical protein n=1 Tax=Vibrio TaxID=662 RepID=UPI0010CA0AED|nr:MULTISPECIES: hypothetical protein [Vibrio]MDN3617041.1 hypothetical protein [Vibrio gallaecicus]
MNLDLFWPTISYGSENAKKELLERDLELLNDLSVNDAIGVTLDESRRLYDQEQARRSTVDSKAGTYIAASTALIPILISLASIITSFDTLIEFNGLSVLGLLTTVAFMFALIMSIRCVMWSHKALKVSSFHLLSWQELITHDNPETLQLQLAKKLLSALRINYDLTNSTVTCVKMAHALLTSAMFWLIVGTLLQAFAYLLNGSEALGGLHNRDAISPIINIFNIKSDPI